MSLANLSGTVDLAGNLIYLYTLVASRRTRAPWVDRMRLNECDSIVEARHVARWNARPISVIPVTANSIVQNDDWHKQEQHKG